MLRFLFCYSTYHSMRSQNIDGVQPRIHIAFLLKAVAVLAATSSDLGITKNQAQIYRRCSLSL
ncbi:phage-shock protein [Vibrio cholerae]|nr:phage-shock protein [Vibrio cholerae]